MVQKKAKRSTGKKASIYDRERAWIVVVNNPTIYDMGDYFKQSTKCEYMVCGFETGKSGTDHIQGYVYYRDAKSMLQMSKRFPRAHLIVAKGTPEENFDYSATAGKHTKKGGTTAGFVEFGTMPAQGRASWDKIEDAMKAPREHTQTYMQYRKAYIDIVAGERKKKDRRMFRMRENEVNEYLANVHSFVCTQPDHYNGESIVMMSPVEYKYSAKDLIKWWLRGNPQMIKYGYQFRQFDPDIILIVHEEDYRDLKPYLKSLPTLYDAEAEENLPTTYSKGKETDEDSEEGSEEFD